MLRPSRAAQVIAVISPLRSIFFRALHKSSRTLAVPRTAQRPSTTRWSPTSSTFSPRQGTSRPLPASTTRPPSSSDRPPIPTDRIHTPPTTSRRLAHLDIPPHQRPKPGGPAPILTARGPKVNPYPSSKPFTPTTYASPDASADTHSASPRRFDEFRLHPLLLAPVHERFGENGKTTAIQTLALRHFLPDFEAPARVLLGAETGSGKTLAYLLPLFSHLKSTDTGPTPDEGKTLNPRALVLSPTHELTRQSTGMAKTLCHTAKLSVMGMSSTKYGGIGDRRGGVDVLFGTGAMTRRMLGLASPRREVKEDEEDVRTGYVGVDRLEWVVIDEADVLLGPDFAEETLTILRHILSARPSTNLVLCTATLPPHLIHLLSTDPLLSPSEFTQLLSPGMHKLPYNLSARFVPPGSGNLLADVAHEVKRVLAEDAVARRELMESGTEVDRSKVVIFCNTDYKVSALSKVLHDKQLPNLAWTGEAAHREHGKNGDLDAFLLDPKSTPSTSPTPKAPSPRILVTTSLLSRGLDFSPLVSTVMLVDQPRDILDFLHRAGRAGRAGRKGRVVVFGWENGGGGSGRGHLMRSGMGAMVARREVGARGGAARRLVGN